MCSCNQYSYEKSGFPSQRSKELEVVEQAFQVLSLNYHMNSMHRTHACISCDLLSVLVQDFTAKSLYLTL